MWSKLEVFIFSKIQEQQIPSHASSLLLMLFPLIVQPVNPSCSGSGMDHIFSFLSPQCARPMGELGKYCLNTCTNEWFSFVSYTPERGCTPVGGLYTLQANPPDSPLSLWTFPGGRPCPWAHLCRAVSLGTCWRCRARRQPGAGTGGSPRVPCRSPGKGPFPPAGCAGR